MQPCSLASETVSQQALMKSVRYKIPVLVTKWHQQNTVTKRNSKTYQKHHEIKHTGQSVVFQTWQSFNVIALCLFILLFHEHTSQKHMINIIYCWLDHIFPPNFCTQDFLNKKEGLFLLKRNTRSLFCSSKNQIHSTRKPSSDIKQCVSNRFTTFVLRISHTKTSEAKYNLKFGC